MIDYAELVLRLKKLEKEYYESMLKKDHKTALLASQEMVVVTKRLQAYTEAVGV
jgi:hypothetical protein